MVYFVDFDYWDKVLLLPSFLPFSLPPSQIQLGRMSAVKLLLTKVLGPLFVDTVYNDDLPNEIFISLV